VLWALAGACASSGIAQAPPVQALSVALLDGRVLSADALVGDPVAGYVVRGPRGEVRVAADQLLALHGSAVQDAGLPAFWLAGGDVLRGALAGGDEAGDVLEVQSPVFDRLPVPVDRLLALTRTGDLRPEQLVLPAGVAEGLFVRARLGFDLLTGSVHQFGERGVRFAATGQTEPSWRGLDELVGLRIADPLPRDGTTAAILWTRTGDRLGVDVVAGTAEGLQVQLEQGRPALVRWRDVASVCWLGRAVHLSEQEPVQVVEAGCDGEVLYPWQRDRAVLGGPLVAGGRSYGKGLGVHSLCRLVYRVPDGVAAFWTRLALDDTAAALPLRPAVAARVLVDQQVVWSTDVLRPGGEPVDLGLLPVRPGQRLVLEVDFGPGRDLGDRAAWLLPVFLPERTKSE
jgi:hypothetical protein